MKNALAVIILIVVMILSSCTLIENDSANSLNPTGSDIENQIDVRPTPETTSEPVKITNVLMPEQELVYRNEAAGYQIAFPEYWRGYYVITEQSNGEVYIGFYGKSKTGQMGYKYVNGLDGLNMGCILNRQDTEMKAYKIGEVNGVEYFFMPMSGNYLPILAEVSDPNNSSVREFVKYEIDATELALVAQDRERAKLMQDSIEDVFKTFMPIR